jgi:hypothetical protein
VQSAGHPGVCSTPVGDWEAKLRALLSLLREVLRPFSVGRGRAQVDNHKLWRVRRLLWCCKNATNKRVWKRSKKEVEVRTRLY